MFLLKIGVPQTCFEIALTWSSSKGRTFHTQRIHQEQLIKYVLRFPHGRIAKLAKKETITIGPPARCARHDITLPGHIKTSVISLGKYVPTIISD